MQPTTETFTHTYRPPVIPVETEHADQRRYGAARNEAFGWGTTSDITERVQLTRHVGERAATLSLDASRFRASLDLDAQAMRALAARLLDAAHDIEQEQAQAAGAGQEAAEVAA